MMDLNPWWASPSPRIGEQECHTNEEKEKALFFCQRVESIQSDIAAVREFTATVTKLSQEAVNATAEGNERKRLGRPLVEQTNRRARRAKNLLSLLQEETHQAQKNTSQLQQGNQQHRNELCDTLTQHFLHEIQLYQTAQLQYKMEIMKNIKLQVHHIQPDATEEEIDDIITSEGRIVSLGESVTYSSIADKLQDVLMLDSSIAELQLLLTEQKGDHPMEDFENIDTNVPTFETMAITMVESIVDGISPCWCGDAQ